MALYSESDVPDWMVRSGQILGASLRSGGPGWTLTWLRVLGFAPSPPSCNDLFVYVCVPASPAFPTGTVGKAPSPFDDLFTYPNPMRGQCKASTVLTTRRGPICYRHRHVLKPPSAIFKMPAMGGG